MKGTFTVAGQRVRSASERRFVAFKLARKFDGVRYVSGNERVEIFKRSDSLPTLRRHIQAQGFHESRHFVVLDTETGNEV